MARRSGRPMAKHLTEVDGRQLAADMLRELGAQWLEQDGFDAEDPDLQEKLINREPCVLRRYLATVVDSKSQALERGFLCTLSDFLGSSVSEGTPEIELYEHTPR